MFESVGRFTYRHRRWVIAFWALFLVAGFVVGGKVFGQLSEGSGSTGSESVRGYELSRQAAAEGATALVLVDGIAVDDPAAGRAVSAAVQALESLPYVSGVHDPYGPEGQALRARDGRGVVLPVMVEESSDMEVISERDAEIEDVVTGAVHATSPEADVSVGGEQAVMIDQMRTTQGDLMRGEMIALPILLVALYFVFRGVRAALLPLAAAVVTVAGALLLLLAATTVVDVAGYAVDVVALFGLALAVDYSLLLVNRFREERGAGATVEDAVVRCTRAAGRTVAFSAATVVASLAGLLVFDNDVFVSLAIGGIATVVVAMAAGVTLVPALLATWGSKIKAVRVNHADHGRFAGLARTVQRRPVLVALSVAALLLVAGLPFLGATYSNGDYRVLPAGTASRDVTDALVGRFEGGQATAPIQVVAEMSPSDPRIAS
ncbi:MAG TPA: MMPL family transporter, partial [Jiangellales bacterium]|nr:MMPL family transporter [Jiangellales bacterium]